MIETTRLNGNLLYVNPHLIESIEETPDTRINFISGKTLIIKNTKEEIFQRIIEYRRQLGILNNQET